MKHCVIVGRFRILYFPKINSGTLLVPNEQIRQYLFRHFYCVFFCRFADHSVNEGRSFYLQRDVNGYTFDYFYMPAIQYTRCSKKVGAHERQDTLITFTYISFKLVLCEFLKLKNSRATMISTFF